MIEGRVTHPEDLNPAINALTDRAKAYLKELSKGGEIKPWMIAKAADWERYGKLKD